MALFKKDNKDKKGDVVRVDALNQIDDDDIDIDDIISSYLPMRRTRLLGKSLLRLDRTRLALLLAILIVLILFIMSFFQEKMGNFTINLDRLELYRKGVAIAADEDFTEPTARLTAAPVENATNISGLDLPNNLEDIDGDHNGINYVAYTYYLRNAGKEDVGYIADLVLEQSSKNAEDAVRVAVWHNGEKKVYAKLAADGNPEPGTEPFVSNKIVCEFTEEEFLVGNVDKFTVVIWMEGDDPECVDKIVGGSVQFSMRVASYNDEDSTLFQKYVRDLIDTITGNKPISAAGNDAPDLTYDNVTWETRRNQ
ncbi:MAG: hypothetical protein MJ150_04480 [Clostridia bacterium]|nr:hypothetical protein [Clostridia bacterium]